MSDSVWPHRRQPQGSPVPGILQARTLEWVAISFSNAWKWKVKAKSLSHVWLFTTPWTAAYQAPPPMGFSRQEYWSGLPLPSPSGHPRRFNFSRFVIHVLTICVYTRHFRKHLKTVLSCRLRISLFSMVTKEKWKQSRSVVSNFLRPHGL